MKKNEEAPNYGAGDSSRQSERKTDFEMHIFSGLVKDLLAFRRKSKKQFKIIKCKIIWHTLHDGDTYHRWFALRGYRHIKHY
eukprot:scaffold4923_cov134-Skeletonema_dohrnii-CCMP3373.AAC.2